jgi:hypothetical protein
VQHRRSRATAAFRSVRHRERAAFPVFATAASSAVEERPFKGRVKRIHCFRASAPVTVISQRKRLGQYSYFCAGGTYSLGTAEPSPKKYCSICLTMTS